MTVYIRRETVAFLRSQGVDLKAMVGAPNGILAEAQLQEIEAKLAARPAGLDDKAEAALSGLRALDRQHEVMIQLEDGLSWAVQVQTGLSDADLANIRTALNVSPPAPLVITATEFEALKAKKGSPGIDNALLSRVARMEGVQTGPRMVQVRIVPENRGALNAADLKFIEEAYSIRPNNGVFDAANYKALLRALQMGGGSERELDLLRRIEEASRENVTLEGVRFDIEMPLGREMRSLMSRYGLSSLTFPDSLTVLARAIDSAGESPAAAADRTLLRRIISKHGKEVPVPGASTGTAQNTQIVDAKFTSRDIDWLKTTFGNVPGFNITDGKLDAEDLDAMTRSLSRLGAAEREVLMARLVASEGQEVGGVKIETTTATQSDVQALIDIYGVEPRDGKINPDQIFDVMQQMQSGDIPKGIAKIFQTLGAGKAPSDRELLTLKDQLGRRRAFLEQATKNPETAARAKADLAKLDAFIARVDGVKDMKFAATSTDDQDMLRFGRSLFRSQPGAADPFAAMFEARINAPALQGREFTLADGKKVTMNLDAGEVQVVVKKPEPPAHDAKMDDAALHKRIADDSRIDRAIDFRWDGSRYVVTLSSENEQTGNAFNLEGAVRGDGKGASLRAKWNTSVPIHPDVWIGLHLGAGASYEYGKNSAGSATHKIAVEGQGGVNLRWYMSRRLGMQLNVQAGLEARGSVTYTPDVFEEDLKLTKDRADKMVDDAKALWDQYEKDVAAMFKGIDKLDQPTKDAIDAAVKAESRNLQSTIGPLMRQRATALLTRSTADDVAADSAIAAAMSASQGNLANQIGAILGDAAKAKFEALKTQFFARTEQLKTDIIAKASEHADAYKSEVVSPFSFGWGMNFTSAINWQARIPLASGAAGSLYFSPRAGVYFNQRIAGKNDGPLLTGERDPSMGRVGVRGELGLDWRIGKSPVLLTAAGGLDQSWRTMDGGREMLVPYARFALTFRW